MIQIFDMDQGGEEWAQARLGIPTASRFATVMARGEGKTRAEYMRKLAGEVITGQPMSSYKSDQMERGNIMENEARETYAFIYDADIRRVGFIRNGMKGASPDSLLGDRGGLEIKTAEAHIQIDRLERDRLPPEHVAQVQGNLWVSEREYWDFVSYWPGLPMLRVRVARDEPYIKNLAGEVDRFNDELAGVVETIRSYGKPRSEILKSQLVQSLMAG